MKYSKKSIAIVPGSFDPITYGHINILLKAAHEYDKVYLAVMINPQKNYMFSIEDRTRIAAAAVSQIDNVEVISYEGMLWELAKSLNATAIVKGYRNEVDLEYEKNMAKYNSEMYPQAETILHKADEKMVNISSTMIRDRLSKNMDISEFMPLPAIAEMKKIIKK